MKVLFITSTRVGDAVLSTGVLAHLIEANPGARVTVACGAPAAPLFGPIPGVERVIVLRKRRWHLHWAGLWAKCATTFWNLIVDLRRSAITYLLPARRRLVLGRGGDEHRVVQLGRLVARGDDPPAPRLWAAQAHRELARRLIPDGPPVLAVGPTANWEGKRWPAENFAALIGRLTAATGPLPGARVALFGAGNERLAANPVIASVPRERRIDLVGKTDLLTAYACLQRCAFYVGNDSGLMHIAAAAGIPTLGLFGPSLDQHYAPWGPNGAVVRTERSYDELVGGPGYDHRTTPTLMESLTVDSAERAACELWARMADVERCQRA